MSLEELTLNPFNVLIWIDVYFDIAGLLSFIISVMQTVTIVLKVDSHIAMSVPSCCI